ncbi:pyruvate formate lyase activating enzyme [Andreprevotia lacus DSM 23236]|jgi:pyruvate formate lyase activating enzyme|uniref:Pyruvate formate-lyase-activating enzyme n=1 Tax=Andreprevotia lacus DSM 23236 TaxID=1121001 RepID=A0A1W1X990_9NEIS|nr:pyruvate formate-lyase-activating protein [Andreprevotia lacus]SMC20459.1 pyruvate formate lyase activating enzyme [Andreprevotia lacus DSM 23236]
MSITPAPGEIAPAVVNEAGQLCGFVHSVETGAAVDGPGVRFVAFMAGCQFRCLYCHNPDTWKLHNGEPRPADELVDQIGRYAGFLKLTGGLTISGGEPLMQAHFVREVFYRAKQRYGLHTALDTQGFLAGHLPDDWFDPVDLVLLDIKHIDPAKYLHITGKPLQPTLDFAERLIRLHKPMWLRYVLVPGLTDDPADIAALARYAQGLAERGPGLIERVEVLPFHKMGEPKWQALGLDYQLSATPVPTPQATESARQIFRDHGLNCC